MSAFIEERRQDFGVEPICRALGVSASAYYERRGGRRSARRVEDERLLAKIEAVHAGAYRAYGSRRVWKELRRRGETVARCTVERLMAANGIQGAKRRGKPWRTTTPDSEGKRKPDLVERDFTAGRPNELWVADFTYLRTWEGVVFFSFVIDVFSRKVIGWGWPPTCAPISSSTPCGWRSACAPRAPMSPWCTTQTEAPNPDSTDPRNTGFQ